jgi:hypothetical protein
MPLPLPVLRQLLGDGGKQSLVHDGRTAIGMRSSDGIIVYEQSTKSCS